MSCYFRHMKDVLDDAGIIVSVENKKQVDALIHQLVNVEYKNCPPTWQAVKAEIKEDPERRARFVARLKEEMSNMIDS